MNLTIHLQDSFGPFLGDGTKGNQFRCDQIEPFWNKVDQVELDFEGVHSINHSFVNAFVGNLVEEHPTDFRQKLVFKNCSPLVKTFVKGTFKLRPKAYRSLELEIQPISKREAFRSAC